MSALATPADAASWLKQLQAQPWFAQVAGIFAQRGVAPPLWEDTLYHEDGSLNPQATTYDPGAGGTSGWSYGLFQLRQPGLGSGASVAALQDPVQNATIAADNMARYLQGKSGLSMADQLRAIENGAWNGSLQYDAERQQTLASLQFAQGVAPGGVTVGEIANTIGAGDAADATAGAQTVKTVANAGGGLMVGLQQLGVLLTIGALFLALIAGGFAILAGGGDAKAPAIIPV